MSVPPVSPRVWRAQQIPRRASRLIPHRLPRRTVAGAVLAVGAGLALVPSPAQAANTAVHLTFDSGAKGSLSLASGGSAVVSSRVITAGSGQVSQIAGATGYAARFPSYAGAGYTQRAVIALTNSTGVDRLTPGAGNFAFAADVALDATSEGTSTDNGNNVVQRGLSGKGAQYKIQADHGQAECRIEGSAGYLLVSVSMPTGSWQRLRCAVTRNGAQATVLFSRRPVSATGGLGSAVTATKTGTIGSMGFAVGTPFTVGGKVKDDLSLATASDQLNGAADNVYLDLG